MGDSGSRCGCGHVPPRGGEDHGTARGHLLLQRWEQTTRWEKEKTKSIIYHWSTSLWQTFVEVLQVYTSRCSLMLNPLVNNNPGRLISVRSLSAADTNRLMLCWCCRFPGAGWSPGTLLDRLPDEAAVGEQGSRGEAGSAIRQVWPGADRPVQQTGTACQNALTPPCLCWMRSLSMMIRDWSDSRCIKWHTANGKTAVGQGRCLIRGPLNMWSRWTGSETTDPAVKGHGVVDRN